LKISDKSIGPISEVKKFDLKSGLLWCSGQKVVVICGDDL